HAGNSGSVNLRFFTVNYTMTFSFSFPKTVFLTAFYCKITLNGLSLMCGSIVTRFHCPEHLESIDSMCDHLSAIVQEEIRAGIPKHRMVIGGFSMAFRMPYDQGFFISLLENASQWPLPELLQCLGTADELVFHRADELVFHSWGEETNSLLKKAGLNMSFPSFPDLNHQLCQQELELLINFFQKEKQT
uniref:palmitoyl-protein hydrolase n=1 Tax=Sinocyclocheilus rhinocerous TaxID=307959 RepID=A0A673JU98_9TELE